MNEVGRVKVKVVAIRVELPVRVAPIRPWHKYAPCQYSPELNWFPEDWETRPDPKVELICAHCPFRTDCMNDALKFDETDGIRGATTPYQRRQLLAERERAKCPCCYSDAVIPSGRGEVCVSCGASWLV
jgi:transcription factor WhiB